MYLALGGVYHPLWAAFPNNPTPRKLEGDAPPATRGLTPALGMATIRRTRAYGSAANRLPIHHISRGPYGPGIRCWALPASLAVTEGILVSFFSSAY